MSDNNKTKQAAWIAIGSFFSFGFTIISSMILSRYFSKADYGTYRQIMYIYSTLLTVSTLGLPKAFSFFLPRVEVSQAKDLIKKITNLFFILGAICSFLIYVGAPLISVLLNNPDLKSALKIFAIVPFLMLPTMGLEGILASFKQTQFMAVYTIVTRIIMLLFVALPVALFRYGYKEAIVGFVLASFIAFLLALYFRYKPVKKLGNEICKITYKEIFSFSLPLFYASLWGTIIVSSDQFFISRYFGNEVFAEFSNGFIELPFVNMVIGACATVLSPVFSKLSSGNVNPIKDIYPIWMSVFKKTTMLIYPILIYCFVFAETLMVVLYGSQYANSDIYFRIKLISSFFTLILYGPLIINIGKVKEYSHIHMVTAILLVVLEYLSVKVFSSPYIIAFLSVACNLGKIYCLMHIAAVYFDVTVLRLFPIKLMIKILLPLFSFLIVLYYILNIFIPNSPIYVLLISLITYAAFLILYDKVAKLHYWSLIKPLVKK